VVVKNDRKFPLNPRLHDARVERAWSQQELADRVGTTPVNISRWENGLTFPSPYFRQRLCEVFGNTLAELGLLPPPTDSRIRDVPITRTPYFTGREPVLALLHNRLSTARTAALTQPQTLYGLGGIGKTQTAAEYAFRYGDEYAHVFWIRAAHEGWLLIMDNADDLRLSQEFLPGSHKGYLLFTTRAQAAGAIAASVEVEKLNPQEGTLLLLRWTKLLDVNTPLEQARATDRADAERIVREMDGLPLAIFQAGAYVEETGCSLADYLRLYATHRKDLLARRSNLLLDYPETVDTTWSLSFQQIEQQNTAAADLLRLCAFLAPDAIPEELLTRGATELGAVLGVASLDPFKLNEALEVLRRYSLVRRNGSTHMLSIHRLVQAVLKESMDQEAQKAWTERAVRAVNAAFPEADDGTGEKQKYYLQYYVPHVRECAMLIAQYHLHFPEAARLLHQAGSFLYFHGFYPQSQSLHWQARSRQG
jgi:transcriptional regulator with XRE-family HTH domain